uniref:MYND-type domain-containing protein n=1 Tax=Chromera velia CCMP2878 TaxID=1169474 RepID=A0A0G4HZ43_9ALVE|eukprot:Cvel_9637.t1-p1 / transcript=Cvel_9637.t1 / gene=Cvel_9637 / organism=Chromera_velia_CCMP2878 / gene_product=hypothetical protein / transcript_product=hypothetical protein / location=Cvel_scaffold560:42210-43849(-) / protein_length=491 / sequence_SO=supercontig / SO=protein_coding / is_pseudo=false
MEGKAGTSEVCLAQLEVLEGSPPQHEAEVSTQVQKELIPEGVLEGEPFAPMREVVVQVLVSRVLLLEKVDGAQSNGTLLKREVLIPFHKACDGLLSVPSNRALTAINMLTAFVKGNPGLILMIWKNGSFRKALKRMIQNLRVTGEMCPMVLLPLFHLLQQFVIQAIPEKVVEALNQERTDEGEGEETRPIDVSHLLRTSLWFVKLAPKVLDKPDWSGKKILYSWGGEARLLRNVCPRKEFAKAAQRAFADSEANGEALELFKMATSGWERETDENTSHDSNTRRFRRSLAIQCTVSNPSVAKYLDKNTVKILTEMRKVMGKAAQDESVMGYEELALFTAWLEAATLRSQSNLEECMYYGKLVHLGDFKKKGLRVQDLLFDLGTMEAMGDRLHPSKQQCKSICPPPCVACGARVSTFMYCGVCKLVVYCGKECQRADWKRKPGGHRQRCALLKENMTEVLLKEGKGAGEGEGRGEEAGFREPEVCKDGIGDG